MSALPLKADITVEGTLLSKIRLTLRQ